MGYGHMWGSYGGYSQPWGMGYGAPWGQGYGGYGYNQIPVQLNPFFSPPGMHPFARFGLLPHHLARQPFVQSYNSYMDIGGVPIAPLSTPVYGPYAMPATHPW
jgi:hypothetical protein